MYYLFALINENWVNILPRSNNLTWSNDKDTLSIEVSFDSIYDLSEGIHIVLKNDETDIFNGLLIKKAKKKLTNSYTCFDMGFYLNKNKTIKQCNDIVASDAIMQICDEFGMLVDMPYISTVINKIYKDQTLASMIEDILELAEKELGIKYVKEMDGYTLRIQALEELRIYPEVLIGKDITVNSSMENMVNSVLVVAGEEKNLYIAGNVRDTGSIDRYGIFQEVMSVDADNEAQAQNIAENHLSANNKIFKDTSLNLVALSGGDDIKANRNIEINIPTMGLSGWYNIKSASHTLSKNKHEVSITLEW